MGNAVALAEINDTPRPTVGGLIRPVATPDELLQLHEEGRRLIADTLKLNRDYGKVPGAQKPTLWKPGAERISVAFGCFPRYRIIEGEVDHDRPVNWTKKSKKWNNKHRDDKTFTWLEESGQSLGLYRYVIECKLVHRASDQVIGEGVGSCSTMESKYVDRPRDLENTVLKMASKRALVAAVLNTFGLSDQFAPEELEEDDDAGAPAPPIADIATFEQRERLAALVREFGDGKGLTRQAQKNLKIAGDLANNENALASHVAEGIAMLEQLKAPTAKPTDQELPFA